MHGILKRCGKPLHIFVRWEFCLFESNLIFTIHFQGKKKERKQLGCGVCDVQIASHTKVVIMKIILSFYLLLSFNKGLLLERWDLTILCLLHNHLKIFDALWYTRIQESDRID